MEYRKQEKVQVNDWGRASSINNIIDNIEALVGDDTLKECVNSISTRVDTLDYTLAERLKGIDETLQDTQTAANASLTAFSNKMEQLKTETENTVNTIVKEIGVVKNITGDKANLYPYFDDKGARRNLVQTSNYLLDIIGYNKDTNTAVEDLTTAKKTLVQAVNEIDNEVGDISALATSKKDSIVNSINEVNSNIGTPKSLITDNKANLVEAVNEVKTKMGNIDTLTVTEKDSLVQAINALTQRINTLEQAGGSTGGTPIKKTTLKNIIFGQRTMSDDGSVKDLPIYDLPVVDGKTKFKQEVDLLEAIANQEHIDKSKINIVSWNFKPYKFDYFWLTQDTEGAIGVAPSTYDMSNILNTKEYMFNVETNTFSFNCFFQLCDENIEDVAAYAYAYATAYADATAYATAYADATASADAYAYASATAYANADYGYGIAKIGARYHIDTKTFTGDKLKFIIYSTSTGLHAKGYINLSIEMRYQVIGD